MSELYKKVGIDETTPVTYVGVYVLKWQPEWGEPSVAFMPAEDDTKLDEIMLCGHMRRYIVSADEGTNHCMECAYEAEIKENIKLRAQLEQAQEAVESARKVIKPLAMWANNTVDEGQRDEDYREIPVLFREIRAAAAWLSAHEVKK